MSEEIFDLVDESGAVIGQAPRSQCHGDPTLLHRVVHVLVVNEAGELLLQKRHPRKDIQPNKWDTSVGGHIGQGEELLQAAVREVGEEIGLALSPDELQPLYRYILRNDVESEMVDTFLLRHNGPFTPQISEVTALQFWSRSAIEENFGSGELTPNFEDEFQHFCDSPGYCLAPC